MLRRFLMSRLLYKAVGCHSDFTVSTLFNDIPQLSLHCEHYKNLMSTLDRDMDTSSCT